MAKDHIVTCAAMLGGLLLIVMGVLGLWFPNLLGIHLGVVVNLAHLASGAAALYWSLNSTSLPWLRISCLGLGVVYGLAGLAGLLFGGSGSPVTLLSGYFVRPILPRMDHLFHLILGAGFICWVWLPAGDDHTGSLQRGKPADAPFGLAFPLRCPPGKQGII